MICTDCGREVRLYGRGMCKRCYCRAAVGGTLEDHPRKTMAERDVVEECQFLLGTGTAEQIAERLGYHGSGTRNAGHTLYRVLHRAERLDLWRRIKEEAA